MNNLKNLIKDYAHMFSAGAIMYFRHTPPKHYLSYVKNGKVPVIILPGLGGRWGFYKPTADHISLLGHPVYIIPKLGNNYKDIPTSAKKVREVIEENNLKNIVIVAHSKGGLISKYLLIHEDPEKRVKGVIAIATPFHGSSMARFIPHSSFRELTPESKIILDLKKHTEINKKIVSIIPSYDNLVWHPEGSLLEGAMQNINVDVAGHNLVANDKLVRNKIIECIEKITKT